MEDEHDAVERQRFMGVCWGQGDPATTFVALDEDGRLADVLHTGQLSGTLRYYEKSATYDTFKDPRKVGRSRRGSSANRCFCAPRHK